MIITAIILLFVAHALSQFDDQAASAFLQRMGCSQVKKGRVLLSLYRTGRHRFECAADAVGRKGRDR